MNYEMRVIDFEDARNHAMESYFLARPGLGRTEDQERIFESGFRMAWDANRRDALRYRWLRGKNLDCIETANGVFAGHVPQRVVVNGADLDEMVDAEMTPNTGLRQEGAGGDRVASKTLL